MNTILTILREPWPWYVAGPTIALIMIILIINGKTFGFSANFSTLCSMAGAGRKISFFSFDWREQRWNLLFLLGTIFGGWLSRHFLETPATLRLSDATQHALNDLGVPFDGGLNPEQLFGIGAFTDPPIIALLLAGGLLIGFGTRYAGGCTSGHAITGISMLQWRSLVAVIGFFIGGLIMTHLIFPLIF